jgi:SAM-dependent methyltransferase
VSPLGSFHGENESEEYFLNDYLPLHEANWENSLAERRAHLAMIQRYCSLPPIPKLLDVGCALGFMLQEAKAAGWKPIGVEASSFAAGYAEEHTGCPVYPGTLQQAQFESDSFDVVTLTDVIEHLANPLELANEIFRILRPGGVLFLTTPNFGSLFVKLYGANAYGIGPEDHASYFQPGTIRRLLSQSGFTRRIVTGSKDFYANNLNRLMRRNGTGAQNTIKSAFGGHTPLGTLRQFVNRVFMHVPIGDKLVALAQK